MSCAEGSLVRTGKNEFTAIEKLFEGAELYGRGNEAALITAPLQFAMRPCVKVKTSEGHALVCERNHPLRLSGGGFVDASESLGRSILTCEGAAGVVSVKSVGRRRVVMIHAEPEQAYDMSGILSEG